jgi:hypothetical protein
MITHSDNTGAQRFAIYETLIAQTRPLWIGLLGGQGAVLEHLEYRSGVTGYRALIGPQSSQPYDDMDSAIAWLAERDLKLPIAAVRAQARSADAKVTMSACGTGIYYLHDAEGEAAEEVFIVPMALTPARIRIDINTMFWDEGIGALSAFDDANRAPEGAEFTAATLPFALDSFLRPTFKTRRDDFHANAPVVRAKLILFQRYARHDPLGLGQFLYDHTAI